MAEKAALFDKQKRIGSIDISRPWPYIEWQGRLFQRDDNYALDKTGGEYIYNERAIEHVTEKLKP